MTKSHPTAAEVRPQEVRQSDKTDVQHHSSSAPQEIAATKRLRHPEREVLVHRASTVEYPLLPSIKPFSAGMLKTVVIRYQLRGIGNLVAGGVSANRNVEFFDSKVAIFILSII